MMKARVELLHCIVFVSITNSWIKLFEYFIKFTFTFMTIE